MKWWRAARAYWVWAIIAGVAFHLADLGEVWMRSVIAFIPALLAVGGIAVIIGQARTARLLGLALAVTMSLLLAPVFLIGVVRELGVSSPAFLVLLLLVATGLGLALYRWKWAKAAIRSGGGKAVPTPRRWRQP